MRRLLCLTPVLALALVACGSSGQEGAGGPPGGGMPPTAVETAKVASQSLPNQIETVGTLRADEAAVIRPEVAGKIEKIHFTEGQRVGAGSLLFSLDASLTQADLNEANANLENSRRANARAGELADKQLVARADLDKAKATLSVDQARAASARTRLEKTQIRAPFEGVVGLREVSAGDYVSAGQSLVDLVRLDPMEVDFRVPEAQLGKMAVGQAVKLSVDAFPSDTFTGEIVAIAPTVDAAGRSVSLRARVPNHDLKLRPGLFARVQIVFGTNPAALMVPEEAIWPNGEQKMVFRVDGGAVKLVPVTLGTRIPGFVEIVDGLEAGDEVVTSGQQKLQDGAKVSTGAPAPAGAADKPAGKPASPTAH
jgi:membrane fusion protein, multidrug efflux system